MLVSTGVEGGFDVSADDYEYHHEYAVVTLPDMKEYALDSTELPDNVGVALVKELWGARSREIERGRERSRERAATKQADF